MSAARFLVILCTGALAAAAAPASAQGQMADAAVACAAPADLPAPLASWRAPVPLRAATAARGLKAATLTPGQSVTLALARTPDVAYPLRPAKPGGSVSYGGLTRFTVDKPGTWRVALSTAAWVDLVRDGAALQSIAHGHGPDCTGVRKMVDFTLSPGEYTIQVAANGADSITLLVTPLP